MGADQRIESVSPASDEVLATFDTATAAQIEEAIEQTGAFGGSI